MKIEQGEKNPILRKKAEPVETINADIKKLMEEMRRVVKKAKGVGLAAPQVGKSLSLFILSLPKALHDKPHPKIFINPRLTERSALEETTEEGCLSLPGIYGEVPRARQIKIKALDENGQEFELEAEEILARVIQHEYDHLEGVLFIDRAVKIKKSPTGRNEL